MGKTLIQPLNLSSLLDSICWTISEPISTASIYIDDSFSDNEDVDNKNSVSAFFDAITDDSFTQSTRLLTERSPYSPSSLRSKLSLQVYKADIVCCVFGMNSERMGMVYKNQFLTLLLPIDWYGEMGPSSRSYFSETGFTCQQILQHIYTFYQVQSRNLYIYECHGLITH